MRAVQCIDANPLGRRRDVIQQANGDEPVVQDQVGPCEAFDRTQRQQAGIAGSGSDKGDGGGRRGRRRLVAAGIRLHHPHPPSVPHTSIISSEEGTSSPSSGSLGDIWMSQMPNSNSRLMGTHKNSMVRASGVGVTRAANTAMPNQA